jgi:predicted SprT family Zn-dependent metalloprotease
MNQHTKTFNYICTKCGSTYTELKKPLQYFDCQVIYPNAVKCRGKLKLIQNI